MCKEEEVYENSISSLKDLLEVQCSDGNWDYDPYMHGMANGMILALSLFEGDVPVYLDTPEKWGEDNPDSSKPVAESQKST